MPVTATVTKFKLSYQKSMIIKKSVTGLDKA